MNREWVILTITGCCLQTIEYNILKFVNCNPRSTLNKLKLSWDITLIDQSSFNYTSP